MAAIASTMGTDVLSVADAALDAARVIGFCFYSSAVVVEYIILFAASQFHGVETLSIGKAFHGIDAQHGISQCGVQFAKYRLSQSDGASFDDTTNHTSDGIAFTFDFPDEFCHFFCFFKVGTTDIVAFYQVEVIALVVMVQLDRSHL